MAIATPLLVENGVRELSGLEQRARRQLAERIESSPAYDAAEIAEITALEKSLFPRDFEISDETRETLRVLCSFSRCELRPASAIRSHRRIVGPIIVFLKKLSWPLIRFHLKDTFESMQLFHSWVVYSHARQVLKLELLERELRQKKTALSEV